MRDYRVMRGVLSIIAKSKVPLQMGDFYQLGDRFSIEPLNMLDYELSRLERDGLVEGGIEFDRSGVCLGGAITGLTVEGAEFFKLIENDEVWEIVLGTLRAADIDISYPLLKEVCEEIVKRYVSSFIPEIPNRT